MKQQDNKMKIFENNISTFKETSIDNDDGKEKATEYSFDYDRSNAWGLSWNCWAS